MFYKIINAILKRLPWLRRRINKYTINRLINQSRHRPHPWSTVHHYVSWTSLTDRKWSARHLPAKKLTPPKNDNLTGFFKRTEQRLSPRSTCLFPAFAQYLTDGFIRTVMPKGEESDDPKRKQNTSNHQLDLSPLYGRTPEQTDVLRHKSEESGKRGRLTSQIIKGEEYSPFLFNGNQIENKFAILDEPLKLNSVRSNTAITSKLFAVGGDRVNVSPQVAMMNTLFLREHNRLAGSIEAENPTWDDEHVFQVARNVTIVVFIKIVVEEYINHISASFEFMADPSIAWNAPWNKPNWLTTEFSLLYRWHQLIPDVMRWDAKPYPAGNTIMNNSLFLNVGLQNAFVEVSAQQAGEIGAFNTADALLDFETKAIEQGRLCQLASYNDYREYAGFKKHKTFSDVSSDRAVVSFLQNAYESVDDIEFYVGLFAEDHGGSGPLPPLLESMVAIDAFSQAMTNPLLSEHVWNEETFAKSGWKTINETGTLRDILARNVPGGLSSDVFVGMTRN